MSLHKNRKKRAVKKRPPKQTEPKLLNLPFDSSLGQTADDLILQDQVDDHDRQGSNQSTGSEDAPVLGVLPGSEDLQAHHDGLHLTLSEQGAGDNELAVSADKTQNGNDHLNWSQERQDEL